MTHQERVPDKTNKSFDLILVHFFVQKYNKTKTTRYNSKTVHGDAIIVSASVSFGKKYIKT